MVMLHYCFGIIKKSIFFLKLYLNSKAIVLLLCPRSETEIQGRKAQKDFFKK